MHINCFIPIDLHKVIKQGLLHALIGWILSLLSFTENLLVSRFYIVQPRYNFLNYETIYNIQYYKKISYNTTHFDPCNPFIMHVKQDR